MYVHFGKVDVRRAMLVSMNWDRNWPVAAPVCSLLTSVAPPGAMYTFVALIQI